MLLEQNESIKLLKRYNIRTVKTQIFTSFPKKISIPFPLALKIDSCEVIHKSDFGLVVINIKDLGELNSELNKFKRIIAKKKIKKYSFVIQEMLKGQELIMGMKRDEVFGPVILFGLGGVFVEVLKDISMRVAPITKKDATEMIREIKGHSLLKGYRNLPAVPIENLVEMLLNLSKLSINEKNISEIDFNPVISGKVLTVVDARIIVDREVNSLA